MKFFPILIIVILLTKLLQAQNPELRGAWVAWAGSSVPSKSQIAETMEKLADANFNVVYVDVWRYGYPYFRSELFHSLTGLYTDPGIDDGRDVLADMIAEGHRVGLEVDAWFESGFAATSGSNIDLFEAKPHWFAQKKSGAKDFYSNGGIRYYWLSHCNVDAQDFLIKFAKEVIRNYDVDGIEFDRIRYPELDCGYDSATVELYKSEHGGNEPPTNTADANWMRWRADKLNLFVARLYDSLKTANEHVEISNAPLPWGYEQFCQDWSSWINNNDLDNVAPQMYYTSNETFTWRLDREMGLVDDDLKMFPGISTSANGETTPASELVKMVQTTRNRGLKGNVHWYANNLIYGTGYLDALKSEVYQEKVFPPYRNEDWERDIIIISENDPGVTRSAGWIIYEAYPGFNGNGQSLVLNGTSGEWIEYSTDIPFDAWYEMYVFIPTQEGADNTHWNAHPDAEYLVYSQKGIDTIVVAQNQKGNGRWYKLGDYFLESGAQKIVRLTDKNLESQLLFTDAVMLIETRRDIEYLSAITENSTGKHPENMILLPAYPNPFNASTNFRFTLRSSTEVQIRVFNTLGQLVWNHVTGKLSAGDQSILWDAEGFPSGVYLYSVFAENQIQFGKVALIK